MYAHLGLLLVIVRSCAASERVVRTAQGPVRGLAEGGVIAFYGVPYAAAPTGAHKFKAPLPPPIRNETLEAVNKDIVCPQGDNFGNLNTKTVQEDCLIANIFIPKTEKKNLPVMVYVHGGAYQYAWGQLLYPKTLVESKKMIGVTFNYRLGVHGFLCLGTEDAPGNAGMKDQVALLRWVQANIANFGGNPNDVTLAGYSAGSSAVDLLLLSKTTKGLFNKVIVESGSNLAPWSVQKDPLNYARKYAKQLGFDNVNSTSALEEFYKNATYELLTSDMMLHNYDSTFVFVPCIERKTKEEMFLEEAPIDILSKGDFVKYPMLYGCTDMDGKYRLSQWKSFMTAMNEKFSDFLPGDLHFKNDKEKENVAKTVKKFYFGNKTVSDETIVGYLKYMTDVMFAYPPLRSIRLQKEAGNNEIFLYHYTFSENHTSSTGVVVSGAPHIAQSVAIYDGTILTTGNVSNAYGPFRNLMRKIWLNFVTTGSPVPKGSSLPPWPAVTDAAARSPHMQLDVPLQLRDAAMLPEVVAFWDSIYAQYYRKPIPPPKPKTL